MSRVLGAIFVIVALAVIAAVLSLPMMLANRNSSVGDYKDELATWHVRWGQAAGTEERRALLKELDAIDIPAASIDLLDQYRIYAGAHHIYSDAEVLVSAGLATVVHDESVGSDAAAACGELTQLVADSPAGPESEITTSSAICTIFSSASKNLVLVRSQALTGWLRDEIQKLNP